MARTLWKGFSQEMAKSFVLLKWTESWICLCVTPTHRSCSSSNSPHPELPRLDYSSYAALLSRPGYDLLEYVSQRCFMRFIVSPQHLAHKRYWEHEEESGSLDRHWAGWFILKSFTMISTPSRQYKNFCKLLLKNFIFIKTIFNCTRTLAENSQSPLNFLISYHLTAIHCLICHSSSFYFAGESFSDAARHINNPSPATIISSSVVLKCILLLGELPNLHAHFTWRYHSWDLSHPFMSAHDTSMCVFCTGLSQTAIPPSWVRAGKWKRRGRIILACSLANRSE